MVETNSLQEGRWDFILNCPMVHVPVHCYKAFVPFNIPIDYSSNRPLVCCNAADPSLGGDKTPSSGGGGDAPPKSDNVPLSGLPVIPITGETGDIITYSSTDLVPKSALRDEPRNPLQQNHTGEGPEITFNSCKESYVEDEIAATNLAGTSVLYACGEFDSQDLNNLVNNHKNKQQLNLVGWFNFKGKPFDVKLPGLSFSRIVLGNCEDTVVLFKHSDGYHRLEYPVYAPVSVALAGVLATSTPVAVSAPVLVRPVPVVLTPEQLKLRDDRIVAETLLMVQSMRRGPRGIYALVRVPRELTSEGLEELMVGYQEAGEVHRAKGRMYGELERALGIHIRVVRRGPTTAQAQRNSRRNVQAGGDAQATPSL